MGAKLSQTSAREHEKSPRNRAFFDGDSAANDHIPKIEKEHA